MKSFRNAAVILMMAAIMAGAALPAEARAQAKTDPRTVAKLAGLLEHSGYTYRKAADNVWVVSFKSSSLGEIKIFVTSADDLVVMGTVVAEKKNMQVTPEMMRQLLKLAHEIDRVKIGFDSDDDLFVRSEVGARLFDLEEFKSYMQQLFAANDKIYAAIKPFLVH